MPRVQINLHDVDQLDELTDLLIEQPRRRGRNDHEGRKPLSREEARDRGRKPRSERQIARAQSVVLM